MSGGFSFSRLSSFHICLLLSIVLFHLCLSNANSDDVLCMDDERQALIQFKHGLVDEAHRLASWVREDNSDCCKWDGIVCDNVTGHVHTIHLPSNCHIDAYSSLESHEECFQQKLRGDLSPSILNLKQLKHLDLSGNDFGGKNIPIFMGSLRNLRYLNLSRSKFGGIIPPQLGNLSELRTLSLGSFQGRYFDDNHELTSMLNYQWLSSLRSLHHLDLSGLDLSNAINWLQVIKTLPSLVELHLSNSQLKHIHPHVASVNLTSLHLLDISGNRFSNILVPRWIFSITSLVSVDLSGCDFRGLIHGSSEGFNNMTFLKLLHVSGNNFMNSSLVLKGLSNSMLNSLEISDCGVSSSVLGSLHNLTSLLSLDLSYNQLTEITPKVLGNLCSLRDIRLSSNPFSNISLTFILESFLECKSPSLVYLELEDNGIVGTIPGSLGRLSFLKHFILARNLLSGQIPFSIKELSSLEVLIVSNNQLNGSLPEGLGQLSNLEYLDISYNLLTGVVTDAHFASLNRLKHLDGTGNNLILRPRLANWHPHFRLEVLKLSSWDLGPQFPLWLPQQNDLIVLEISNTRISSTMPLSFWRFFPNLLFIDMSQNCIQGRLPNIPSTLIVLNLSYNKFSGQLPKLSNSSSAFYLDLSYNSFVGLLRHLICPYGGKQLAGLKLTDNHLSGAIPNQCWEKCPNLKSLNLENNNLSGGIPRTMGSLSFLTSLNMCNNKLSGRLPTTLKNLTNLMMLLLARNKFVGRIPTWFGTELSALRILSLRSNNFHRNITRELCYLTSIQILDLSHNSLSGDVPKCFSNFTILSGKEVIPIHRYIFKSYYYKNLLDSASLVIKGREDKYSTILRLVMIVDLSSNNLSGSIPSELMALQELQSLNLSRNQLTGSIPENIGDLKSLVAFDVSFNRLSGKLPVSLSSLTFLSSFNVSYNQFTGRIPTSTQLQSFDESSFFGNSLCGDPMIESCAVALPNVGQEKKEKDGSHGADWGFIISMVTGFIVGFWVVLAPLIVNTTWRIAYFGFLRKFKYMVCDVVRKYWCNVFYKR